MVVAARVEREPGEVIECRHADEHQPGNADHDEGAAQGCARRSRNRQQRCKRQGGHRPARQIAGHVLVARAGRQVGEPEGRGRRPGQRRDVAPGAQRADEPRDHEDRGQPRRQPADRARNLHDRATPGARWWPAEIPPSPSPPGSTTAGTATRCPAACCRSGPSAAPDQRRSGTRPRRSVPRRGRRRTSSSSCSGRSADRASPTPCASRKPSTVISSVTYGGRSSASGGLRSVGGRLKNQTGNRLKTSQPLVMTAEHVGSGERQSARTSQLWGRPVLS